MPRDRVSASGTTGPQAAAGGAGAGAASAEAVRERIRALLGRAEYARFFAALRARCEAAGEEPARTVQLPVLEAREASALAGLLGLKRVPQGGERLRIAEIEAALRATAVGAGLREVLEALGGPLVDRRRARAGAAAVRQASWEKARSDPAIAARSELVGWLEELRARGLVARAASGAGMDEAALLELACAAAARLPAGGVLLPVFASELTGDAHALDAGTPLAGLVLRAAALLAGRSEVPSGAGERRRLWAEVGVLCDPLSAQVLVLGLRPAGDERLARQLRESAADGEPRRITLRELSAAEPVVAAGTEVYVCENPSVVAAAADQLGARCRPLVCVEGVPSTAAIGLLRSLARAGAKMRFHADFDWAGIRIGNLLAKETGAGAWRFGCADYLAARAALGAGVALRGAAVEAEWDGALRGAMEREGRAVFEEHVLEALLADLAAGSFA